MYTSTVSSQGQTTIPAKVRQSLGLTPESQIVWHITGDDSDLNSVMVTSPSLKTLLSLKGIAKNYYKKYTTGSNYLRQERSTWDQKSI